MPRIYLVRHGRAAASWTEDADPDLDDVGREQSVAVAVELAELGPLRMVSSPLRRARSTAQALERIWGITAAVDPRVGEIPSPSLPLALRGRWLAGVMGATWDDPALTDGLRAWRRGIVEALMALPDDTVVTTHFVAINAAVGEATGDGRITVCRPDHCSCTVMESTPNGLRLLVRGRESATVVQ